MAYQSKPYLLYGGDYNPDQWDRETIQKDMKLFREAGVNTLILPVFSWTRLEPREGEYEFGWLDEILDILDENNLGYILATPTSAQPAWMSQKYPEILPVDISGRRRTHGMRVFFCYNSEKYRERAAAIARAMADRYSKRTGLLGWHVANEYGTSCYCEHCQGKFREWLKARYGGIEELNRAWHTSFWNRTVGSFDEIMLPTELNDDYRFCPAVELDYQRFKTDSTLECYHNEADILKAATPDLPVFTNISGFIKKLDQFKMVPEMDVAGWDNYPAPDAKRSLVALKHDIMRAAGNGRSYYVAEQSPNQQNWQPYNKLKRPGEIRRIAYQGLAHGSDSSLYFQMRQSIAGQEKLHGAMIGRDGGNQTRIFREMVQMGQEFAQLGDRFVGAETKSEVGVLFDWNSWWALELCSGPTKDLDYLQDVFQYYEPFYNHNVSVDVVKYTSDFSKYKILIAPSMYMLKDGVAQRLEEFVREGGTLLTGYLSGYVDENDRSIYGSYPGPLREVMGLWVEETDALYPEERNQILMKNTDQVYECSFLCDLVHPEGAEVLAEYGRDFYQGRPVVTKNRYGKGQAYYLASRPDSCFMEMLAGSLLKEKNISPDFQTDGDVEIAKRVKGQEETWFLINFGNVPAEIRSETDGYQDILSGRKLEKCFEIPAGEVMVIGKE